MTTTTLPAELASSPTANPRPVAGAWVADPSHSEASFTVRHAVTGKVRGWIAITEATLTIGEDLWASSVTATLDAASVDTRDASRDDFVRGPDFFDAESFPVWTFVSTSVTGSGSQGQVTGDLTIHGVTREVSLTTEFNAAVLAPGNLRAGFTASTEISRRSFGLTLSAVQEAGGVLLSDKIKVNLTIEAIPAQRRA